MAGGLKAVEEPQQRLIRCVIFDLSEVLIAGLVGIEKELAPELAVPEAEILPCFGGRLLKELCLGDISENTYLQHVVAREGWPIRPDRLKAVIRRNFHNKVEGSQAILSELASRYKVALLSDNALEWTSYIRSIHPFLRTFDRAFFSFELKSTKEDPSTFLLVLDAMALSPHDCLFVDDNQKNVDAAQSVGIAAIRFANAQQLADELRRRHI